MQDTFESLLPIAYEAALQAGVQILKVYESDDFSVESKADDSPLTLADRRAHETIAAVLERARLPILSEEGADIPAAERRSWEQYWLIDPLDGTKEFIKRNGEFTVNIALMAPVGGGRASAEGAAYTDKGVQVEGTARAQETLHAPVAGVVYVPVKDIAYIGLVGKGAWRIDGAAEKAGGEAAASSLEDFEELISSGRGLQQGRGEGAKALAAVMSRSHNSAESEALVAALEERYGRAERVSSGSSIKLCLVAEGTADVYPRFAPTMEWDTAAGDAVCRAAGCRVTEADGKTPLRYNKDDLHNPWFLVYSERVDDGIETAAALAGEAGSDRSSGRP